ncbi:MAG: EamA family transporter, partial [Bdellovibrionales bacterium]|nr:EamA family transporter [Bdellovibrionales bacterium]
MTSLYFALASNISFALAIIIYTSMSHKTTVLWTNCVKSLTAVIAFSFTILLTTGWHSLHFTPFFLLFLSGGLGLAIGDQFLLKAFTIIGPARTMVLFSFQPLFMGVMAYILFQQKMATHRWIAIFFLIGCLMIFSYERYRIHRHWGIKGISFALIGVLMDGIGILMTRYSFDHAPFITSFEGNFY